MIVAGRPCTTGVTGVAGVRPGLPEGDAGGLMPSFGSVAVAVGAGRIAGVPGVVPAVVGLPARVGVAPTVPGVGALVGGGVAGAGARPRQPCAKRRASTAPSASRRSNRTIPPAMVGHKRGVATSRAPHGPRHTHRTS